MGDRIKATLFLCRTENKNLLDILPDELQYSIDKNLNVKAQILSQIYPPPRWSGIKEKTIEFSKLFPFKIQLSEGIDFTSWLNSMLVQPRLFIRAHKNREEVVTLLRKNGIKYQTHNFIYPVSGTHGISTSLCISLDNGTAIDKILPSHTYVVQDMSSQETGLYFQPHAGQDWWDCCAGAGGKSLLLKSIQPAIHLTVSDKRDTILHNLTTRFRQYFNEAPSRFVLDIADKEETKKAVGDKKFDGIICDVPCTGSGTWARTPEQMYFFDEQRLKELSALQPEIAINAAAYLKPGGRLIYVTCSVFKEENEDVITDVLKKTDLQLESMKLINGLEHKADSMFAAVLTKPA